MTVQTKHRETEMQQMMKQYQQLATPGKQHELLSQMEGTFSAKVKHWENLDQPPSESEGTSKRTMILGGRYLQEEMQGDMMGIPFNGIGITGYDNHNQKYVSIWFDSMSTGIYFFEGSASPDGKTINFQGSYNDSIRGPLQWDFILKIQDKNTQSFEMNTIDSNNNQERCLISYSRKR